MIPLRNSFLSSFNENALSPEAFKAVCKRTCQVLNDRGVSAKLSDLHEGLAVGLGFENYATYLGLARQQLSKIVQAFPDSSEGKYIAVLVDGCIGSHDATEGTVFLDLDSLAKAGKSYTPVSHGGPRLNDFHGKTRDFYHYSDDFESLNTDLSPLDYGKMVVTSVLVQCPRTDRYGVPYYGDVVSLKDRILSDYLYGVYDKVEAEVHDSGDDTYGYTIFEVFVPNDLLPKLRG